MIVVTRLSYKDLIAVKSISHYILLLFLLRCSCQSNGGPQEVASRWRSKSQRSEPSISFLIYGIEV